MVMGGMHGDELWEECIIMVMNPGGIVNGDERAW